MENLRDIIQKKLQNDGKLSCSDAFAIAKENNISTTTVGNECNNLNIKIKGCQLGCF